MASRLPLTYSDRRRARKPWFAEPSEMHKGCNSYMKSLPGAFRESTRHNKSRLDNLHEVVEPWAHLISFDVEIYMFRLIQLDLVKFDDMLKKYGHSAFGGGFQAWPPVWEAKDEFSSISRQRPDEHKTTHNHLTVQPTGSFDEWINITALGEALNAGRIQRKVENGSDCLVCGTARQMQRGGTRTTQYAA